MAPSPALLLVSDAGERPVRRSSRKRAAMVVDSSGHLSTASSEGSSSAESGRQPGSACRQATAKSATRNNKKKKPWYAVQKDEKKALEKEIARLRAQKEHYQQSVPARVAVLLRLERENETLRRAMHEQQLMLAQSKSALTGYAKSQRPPLERKIHLGSDWRQRVATIAHHKTSLLRDTERYITERMRFLDPLLPHSESERFVTPTGDTFFTGFSITPLASLLERADGGDAGGALSVKQVFDAMRMFMFNLEIAWTEKSGVLMVREGEYESAGGDPDVSTQRFVRTLGSGTRVESNALLFSKFTPAADDDEDEDSDRDGTESPHASALMTVHFVDSDELHPYRPSERLRHDILGAYSLRTYPMVSGGARTSPADAATELVLVQTYSMRLHRSVLLPRPNEVVDEILYNSSVLSKELLKTVFDGLCTSQ